MSLHIIDDSTISMRLASGNRLVFHCANLDAVQGADLELSILDEKDNVIAQEQDTFVGELGDEAVLDWLEAFGESVEDDDDRQELRAALRQLICG